jgi:GDP-L-fucose synthase
LFDQRTRVYIAGHRGMVGSAILRAFKRLGYDELILRTRSEVDLCEGSAVERLFKETRPELVVLAAARVGGILANDTFPADFIRENLLIQTNVIDCAHRYGAKRVLFLGSSCIYPKEAPNPISETALLTGPLEATNRAYALAKIAGVEMCWSYNRQYIKQSDDARRFTSYLAVMPTNLYGPGDNYHQTNSHVIPALIRRFHEAKLSGQDQVLVWGSGQPRREFMHVDDMAAACVGLLQLEQSRWLSLTAHDRNEGEAPLVNIGTGEDLSIRELAHCIAGVVGFQGRIGFDASKPDGTMRKLMSNDKLKSLIQIKPRTLEQGLIQVYRDYASRVPEPSPQR